MVTTPVAGSVVNSTPALIETFPLGNLATLEGKGTRSKSIVKPNTFYQWRRVYTRANKNNQCPTLTANMGTGGHNVPLVLVDKKKKIIRKIKLK